AVADREAAASDLIGLAIYSAEGELLEQRGQELPAQIQLYGKFYLGTAEFLSGQLGDGKPAQVSVDFQNKRLVMRHLGDAVLLSCYAAAPTREQQRTSGALGGS
ncbi:hypothetical protein ACFP81_13470, partial [Deinococcus lacus]